MDKGKGKIPEYEVDHPDNNDSDVSAPSLDSEFGVSIMRTPRVKKALTVANEKLYRSSRAKNLVSQCTYNEYMAHHYAFTIKVAAKQEPEIPSLRHMLEGEESDYHEPHKAAENRTKAKPHKAAQRPNHTNPRKDQTTQSHTQAEPHKAAQRLNRAEPHGC